jgi:hypothetical protein
MSQTHADGLEYFVTAEDQQMHVCTFSLAKNEHVGYTTLPQGCGRWRGPRYFICVHVIAPKRIGYNNYTCY